MGLYNVSATGGKPSIPVEALPTIENKAITIPTGSWKQNGNYYEYKIINEKITPDSVVNVAFDIASLEFVRAADVQPTSTSGDGVCTLYAVNVPTADLSATYSILKAGEQDAGESQ